MRGDKSVEYLLGIKHIFKAEGVYLYSVKIFSAEQIKAWDQDTIQHEPIESIQLMERASAKVAAWIKSNFTHQNHFMVFAGNGNNGGDGLAVARMLFEAGYLVRVFMIEQNPLSQNCQVNLNRLKDRYIPVSTMQSSEDFPFISAQHIVIDALFGTGLNKAVSGMYSELIQYLNTHSSYIVSIDVPSGLFCDRSSIGNTVIKANSTLSFQSPKLAFFWPENEVFVGEIVLLDINLDKNFYHRTPSNCYTISTDTVTSLYKKRLKSTHKYTYGNALIVAGSKSMMGAALLCAKACMRSGAGLVTIPLEESLAQIVHIAIPEAIVSFEKSVEALLQKKKAVAFGPGIEISDYNRELLHHLLNQKEIPVVIDATGLHIVSEFIKNNPELSIPHLILTPHLGEFEMLFGKDNNDYERMNTCVKMANKLKCIIILKGHHTLIALPDGELYYNTTGNCGMATAGSGDVLTGIITGLLAQGYDAKAASLLGVYLHGLAGDIGAKKLSKESLIASDLIEHLGEAYLSIQSYV